MVFEVRKGRACDSVQRTQAKELQKMGLELAATKEGLKMAVNALAASQSEATHLRQALTASESITKETGRKERKKGRREGAGIVAVIAVVLLLL